jgi:drug/metabolite transporter (DMT)-like permease
VVGFSASVLLMLNASHEPFTLNRYAIFIIIATACYGFNINLVKNYLAQVPSLSISAVSVTTAGLVAFIFGFLPRIEHYHLSQSNLNAFLCLLLLGVLGTAFAQYLHNKLISVSSSLFASTSTYLIPIIAIFWGVADGEKLSWIHFVAMGGVLVAVLCIRKERRPS